MNVDMFTYFVGCALQGMLAHSRGNPPHGYRPTDPTQPWHEAICEEAYEIALTMMETIAKIEQEKRRIRYDTRP